MPENRREASMDGLVSFPLCPDNHERSVFIERRTAMPDKGSKDKGRKEKKKKPLHDLKEKKKLKKEKKINKV
jgi:hypothetical protein